jgi:type I restriction enzyme, R subunit
MAMVTADREVYDLIRAGVRVEFHGDGRNRVDQVRVIDFKDAEANEFLGVSQMWIQGEVRYRRPYILHYINGLPLVFGQEFLDESLVVKNDAKDHRIPQTGKVWDLSKVDFDKLRKDFKASAHRNIKIAEMRAFIEKKLLAMLTRNRSRAAFAERLQEIIDEYNTGSSSTDRIFDELTRFMGDMSEEDERHTRLGPTEDELEIYDLLKKEKMTQSEEKKVRLAAKALMKRLLEEAPRVLVQDWFKAAQTRPVVRDAVGEVLDKTLLDSYDRDLFAKKRDSVFELVLDLAEHRAKWAS